MSLFREICRWAAAGLVAGAAVLGGASANAADVVPLAAFFTNNDISSARLSPSGRYLGLRVASKSGRTVLAVVEIGSDKPPVVVASAPDVDIRSFSWVNDDRLVYSIVDLQAAGGDQLYGPGLFSVKRDGEEPRQLIRALSSTDFTRTAGNVLGTDHVLLFVPQSGGNDVIVGQYERDNEGTVTGVLPKRVDVTTGRSRPATSGYPDGAVGWVFDRSGEPRVLQTVRNGMSEVYWRAPGQDRWQSLIKAPLLDLPWYPTALDDADRLYVVAKSPDSTEVLKRFDFATGSPEPAALVSAPGFDTRGGLLFDNEKGRRLVGVRIETDAAATVWFDPGRKKLQALADARFANLVNEVWCQGCESGGAMLVLSYSDRDPGTYSVYRPSTEQWTTIGRVRRAVDPKQMATLDLFRIKARDGMDLPVWVTSPREKATSSRAAVVLVHGGPWVRGTHWRWESGAQFLASRGYVVIEPEFRGSDGFGERHFRAGFKQWGTSMQDDVADAVRWAAEKGLVDGKRVCIAGASYGGYATLMGAIRYPDLYRCGVAWVAVTDPRLLFEPSWVSDISREGRNYTMPIMIGDPVKDADLLKAAAPLERAGEIKIPVLMAFGSVDRRVPVEHGTRMRAAMKAAGHEPEYVVYPGEGQAWLKVENRIDFWQRVEKFLARNLN